MHAIPQLRVMLSVECTDASAWRSRDALVERAKEPTQVFRAFASAYHIPESSESRIAVVASHCSTCTA